MSSLKIIVTGLPRSGTSFLTSLVHHMGFSVGNGQKLKPADKYNKTGYFEYLPLMKISDQIFNRLGNDFFTQLPELDNGWTRPFESEKQSILQCVQEDHIELYKDNKLVILADLYDELFPNAKWIFIERCIEETYRSRFGQPLSIKQWEKITENRLTCWNKTKPSKKALYVKYSNFSNNFEHQVDEIAKFTGIINPQVTILKNLFKPGRTAKG